MRIRRIALSNIGCFQEKTVDFKNMTVIHGENRSGKSTLVYALYFTLFDRHLNTSLTLKDLKRKGEQNGTADLQFSDNGATYRLRRSTDRVPQLWELDTAVGGGDLLNGHSQNWQPIDLKDPETYKRYVALTPETAALSSFFRESELIYFLQDVPKYNKTLLQSLIGIDEILIVKSRFKKALARAREYEKGIREAAPKTPADALNMALARRQLADAERDIRLIETEYQRVLDGSGKDPTVFKLLKKQLEDKQRERITLQNMAKDMPKPAELDAREAALKEQTAEEKEITEQVEAIHRRLGGFAQKSENMVLRLKHLKRLEDRPNCPVCYQEVPQAQLAHLIAKFEKAMADNEAERASQEKHLAALKDREKNVREAWKGIEKIRAQKKEIRDVSERIAVLDEQLAVLEADLAHFASSHGELKEAEDRYLRRSELENRRNKVQDDIVKCKIALEQQTLLERRIAENKAHLMDAERRTKICTVAHQAFEDAVKGLGSRLLDQVKASIQTWSGHFSFLDRFEIEMTDRELLPVIQAKGYQYKLNQMSKSERIFLYIMLKLAIGDALGHMGMFVLDDPADGLDSKRKSVLAYLLAEVARQRQVIVTTNDAEFAGFFTEAHRINL
jgi:DNA repair exonuclease SbcCD ATPase subunit